MPSDIYQLARLHDHAVSVDFIVETGEVPLTSLPANQSRIDLSNTEAASIRALDEATETARLRLLYDPVMGDLLEAPRWTRDQREAFEQRQAEAVAAAFHEQPLFADYRPGGADWKDVGKDLTKLTPAHELDCDGMAILKGIMTHRVEHALLAEGGDGGLKEPGRYFVVAGGSQDSVRAPLVIGHAALISEKTGNLIEPTIDTTPYLRAVGDFSFGDYVAGRPFIAEIPTRRDGATAVVEYRMGSVAADWQQMLTRRAAFIAGDTATLDRVVSDDVVTWDDYGRAVDSEHRWRAATEGMRKVETAEPAAPSSEPLPAATPRGAVPEHGR